MSLDKSPKKVFKEFGPVDLRLLDMNMWQKKWNECVWHKLSKLQCPTLGGTPLLITSEGHTGGKGSDPANCWFRFGRVLLTHSSTLVLPNAPDDFVPASISCLR